MSLISSFLHQDYNTFAPSYGVKSWKVMEGVGKEGGSRNTVGLGLLLHKERESGVNNVSQCLS